MNECLTHWYEENNVIRDQPEEIPVIRENEENIRLNEQESEWEFLEVWAKVVNMMNCNPYQPFTPPQGEEVPLRPKMRVLGIMGHHLTQIDLWPKHLSQNSTPLKTGKARISVMNKSNEDGIPIRNSRPRTKDQEAGNDRLNTIQVELTQGVRKQTSLGSYGALLDTGARICAINSETYLQLERKHPFLVDHIARPAYEVEGADSSILKCRGVITLMTNVKGVLAANAFYIIDGLPCEVLLGMTWITSVQADILFSSQTIRIGPKGNKIETKMGKLLHREIGKGVMTVRILGKRKRNLDPTSQSEAKVRQPRRTRWIAPRTETLIWLEPTEDKILKEYTVIPRFILPPPSGVSVRREGFHHIEQRGIPVRIRNQNPFKIDLGLLDMAVSLHDPSPTLKETSPELLKAFTAEILESEEQGLCRCTPKQVFTIKIPDRFQCSYCKGPQTNSEEERTKDPEKKTFRRSKTRQMRNPEDEFKQLENRITRRLIRGENRPPGPKEIKVVQDNYLEKIIALEHHLGLPMPYLRELVAALEQERPSKREIIETRDPVTTKILNINHKEEIDTDCIREPEKPYPSEPEAVGKEQEIRTQMKARKGFYKPGTKLQHTPIPEDKEIMWTSDQYGEDTEIVSGTNAGVPWPTRESVHTGEIPEEAPAWTSTPMASGSEKGKKKLEELEESDLRFLTSRPHRDEAEWRKKQHELQRMEVFGKRRYPHTFVRECLKIEAEADQDKDELIQQIIQEVDQMRGVTRIQKEKVTRSLLGAKRKQNLAKIQAQKVVEQENQASIQEPLRPGGSKLGRRDECICDPQFVPTDNCICLGPLWKPGNYIKLNSGKSYGAFGQLMPEINHPRSRKVEYDEGMIIKVMGQINLGHLDKDQAKDIRTIILENVSCIARSKMDFGLSRYYSHSAELWWKDSYQPGRTRPFPMSTKKGDVLEAYLKEMCTSGHLELSTALATVRVFAIPKPGSTEKEPNFRVIWVRM